MYLLNTWCDDGGRIKMNISEANVKRLTEMTKKVRFSGLEMAVCFGSQEVYLGCCLSCIETMSVLYGVFLHVNPKNSLAPDRDVFMLSKAHYVLPYISILAEKELFERDEIFKYLDDGERIIGHPYRPDIGLEHPGGNLGMVISVVIGKYRQRKGTANNDSMC